MAHQEVTQADTVAHPGDTQAVMVALPEDTQADTVAHPEGTVEDTAVHMVVTELDMADLKVGMEALLSLQTTKDLRTEVAHAVVAALLVQPDQLEHPDVQELLDVVARLVNLETQVVLPAALHAIL